MAHPDCGLTKLPHKPQRIVLHPDCGLRTLGNREIARAKLKNMAAAAKLF
jgi:methionine synthase II (cobalamin-independent)